jgi:glutamate/tyrosine decarboxylase-like PLP-dependent enzyme
MSEAANKNDLDYEKIRDLGHLAIDRLIDHLSALRNGPVYVAVPDNERQSLLNQPLPMQGTDPLKIIDDIITEVFRFPMGNNHPRFFGWVNSPAAPVSIIASLLAAGLNPSCAGGDHAAIYLERAVLDWIKTLLGFPPRAMGLLVGGGSSANLTGLAVARHVLLARSGWGVREKGMNGAPPVAVFMTDQSHSSITKAVELLGMGRSAIKQLPADAQYRMDVAALGRAVGNEPNGEGRAAIVIANAGTVNTGSVDPLDDIADLCAEKGLWLHIDGAYGAPAILADQTHEFFKGLGRADSIAVDPHKWLYVPVDCGCVIVRDEPAMRQAFSLVPPYLKDSSGAPPWFSEYTHEQTRPFRALKLWAALRERGVEGYRADINRDLDHARRLARQIQESPDFELVAPVTLSVVAFRYTPRAFAGNAERIDNLNSILPRAIQEQGRVFLSGTVLRGRPVLRCCFVNFNTTEQDVDEILDAVRAAAPM